MTAKAEVPAPVPLSEIRAALETAVTTLVTETHRHRQVVRSGHAGVKKQTNSYDDLEKTWLAGKRLFNRTAMYHEQVIQAQMQDEADQAVAAATARRDTARGLDESRAERSLQVALARQESTRKLADPTKADEHLQAFVDAKKARLKALRLILVDREIPHSK